MSNKKTGLKIVTVIIALAVIAVLALAAVFIARYTNNFTTKFKTFYVEYDGKMISSDTTDLKFYRDFPARIKVGYSLGFLNKNKSGYNVKVVPNVTGKTDFEYTVGREYYLYSQIDDLTEYFKIEKYEDYFDFKADKSLSEVIQSMYDGQAVEGVPQGDKAANLLKLVISTEDNSVSLNLAFTVCDGSVEIIPSDIVFWGA